MVGGAGLFLATYGYDVFRSRLVSNADADVVLPVAGCDKVAQIYLAGHDPLDPRVSPVSGDFTGARRVFLTVGDGEILLNDTSRMADVQRGGGGQVVCEICRELPHVWPLFASWLPEAANTVDLVVGFVGLVLSARVANFWTASKRQHPPNNPKNQH